jgi:phosphatidylinositol-bisphosphatase
MYNAIEIIISRQVIVNSLHRKGVYVQVALVRLVGIMLLVYALEPHIPYIENVSTDTVGTGIMGKLVKF